MKSALLCTSILLLASSVIAQAPPAVVGVEEARSIDARSTLELPATVDSPLETVVAAEVSGRVIEVAVREGDRVKKGQRLARLRTTPYELQMQEARATLIESQARLQLAQRNRQRARDLFAEEVVSQQDLDNADSELAAWQGRVDQAEARIAQLQLALELCEIRAPFSGTVTERLTEVGRWLLAGGDVVGLVSLSPLEMRVDVPERYFASLKNGTRATITLDALDGSWSGKVTRIVPRAQGEARTYPVFVAIDRKNANIGVGMLGRVALPLGSKQQQTIVPKDAIVRSGGRNLIYRLLADNTVEAIDVQLGSGHDDWIVIRNGIAAGDRVVTRGNERLQPGQAVQPR